MINSRVLELIKNPKNIQPEDLLLLKKEIDAFPYIQNIRALHLYGIHLHNPENYQKELSVTAAYTTDKKILYQLINGKIKPVQEETVPEETSVKPENRQQTILKHDYEAVSEALMTDKTEIKHIVINGERNRILYEGEENFLNDSNIETIDLESTLESGKIITQKKLAETESLLNKTDDPEKVSEELNIETVIDENGTYEAEAKSIVQDESELSFQKIESFPAEPESSLIKTDDPEKVSEELNIETVIDANETHEAEAKSIVQDESELSFQKIESFPAEPESSLNKTDDPEKVSEELNIETVINENETHEAEAKSIVQDESELSFQKIETFPSESESSLNKTDDPEKVAEELNIETVIDENEMPKTEAKSIVHDESELSFQKIEAFPAERESLLNKTDDSEKVSEELNIETIIDENKLDSEKTEKTLTSNAELSFHGMESFLPGIKIPSANPLEKQVPETVKSPGNKHEDEMRRLIEEVEKKMKQQKVETDTKAETVEETGSGISFAETQDFVVESDAPAEDQKIDPSEENVSESSEKPAPEQAAWKPMSFESHVPDSFSRKIEFPETEAPDTAPDLQTAAPDVKEESSEVAIEENINNTPEPTADSPENNEKEEVRVMNVSFFGSDISSLSLKNEATENKKEEEILQTSKPSEGTTLDSNIPGFINTWQSWLKIDRTPEIEQAKAEIKTKAIDSFIENNPKISQLKDEVNFVVKEKTDDISHLMTETLANIYNEQKLYTKAINAFQILALKYPERKEYFEGKIQEIKDQRGKN